MKTKEEEELNMSHENDYPISPKYLCSNEASHWLRLNCTAGSPEFPDGIWCMTYINHLKSNF